MEVDINENQISELENKKQELELRLVCQNIWFGSKKYSEEVLCSGKNLTWGMTSFKL